MNAAERLSATKPQEAAAMYGAIVDLFGDSAWAKDIVAEARQRLSELERRP